MLLAGPAVVVEAGDNRDEPLQGVTVEASLISACRKDCDGDGDGAPLPGETTVTYAFIGDISWCNDNRLNWENTIEVDMIPQVNETFEDTDVNVDFVWAACTFTPIGEEYDHDAGNYTHDHGGDDLFFYPFNKVSADHTVYDCKGPKTSNNVDDGYLNAEIGWMDNVDNVWRPNNTYNDFVGVFAYRYDIETYHEDANGDPLPHADLVHLLHDTEVSHDQDGTLAGIGCLPRAGNGQKEGSLAMQPQTPDDPFDVEWLSAHEVGHSMDAIHCDASENLDGSWTVMADDDDDDNCEPNEPAAHRREFSLDNTDNVETYAQDTYG